MMTHIQLQTNLSCWVQETSWSKLTYVLIKKGSNMLPQNAFFLNLSDLPRDSTALVTSVSLEYQNVSFLVGDNYKW